MAYRLETIPADQAQLVTEHVKGHRCGYALNAQTGDEDIKIIDQRCISGYRVRMVQPARPPVAITPQVLDALNSGSHGLRAVQDVRAILEAAGLKVALHQHEKMEAKRLREAAARFLEDADKIDGGTETDG